MQKFFLITLIALAVVFQTLYARSLMKVQKPTSVAQSTVSEEETQPLHEIESTENGSSEPAHISPRMPDNVPDSDLGPAPQSNVEEAPAAD